MYLHPNIDPVAFSVGPLKVHWYGLMYLLGFFVGYWLGVWRTRKPWCGWKKDEVADVMIYILFGVLIGGRLGYVFFYKPGDYLADPLQILFVWQGGMAFHGALVGVILAMWLFGRKTGRSFFAVADFVAPLTPIGLGAGRVGNFINQELWGKVSDAPWAMVFRTDPLSQPRHPSMLYEALLEGVVLFLILWFYSSRPRTVGRVSGMFLTCYGAFRFLVEFVREPDAHLGYLALGWVTMGQVLSLPMILFGLWLLFRTVPERTTAA